MVNSDRNKTIRYSELPSEVLYQNVKKDIDSLELTINKTVHGDSLELLAKIPTWSIDLIATDPPYNLDKTYASSKFSATDNRSYEEWLELWMKECKRVLKSKWSIYVCCDWKSSIPVFNALSKFFILKNQ